MTLSSKVGELYLQPASARRFAYMEPMAPMPMIPTTKDSFTMFDTHRPIPVTKQFQGTTVSGLAISKLDRINSKPQQRLVFRCTIPVVKSKSIMQESYKPTTEQKKRLEDITGAGKTRSENFFFFSPLLGFHFHRKPSPAAPRNFFPNSSKQFLPLPSNKINRCRHASKEKGRTRRHREHLSRATSQRR